MKYFLVATMLAGLLALVMWAQLPPHSRPNEDPGPKLKQSQIEAILK